MMESQYLMDIGGYWYLEHSKNQKIQEDIWLFLSLFSIFL